MRVSLAAVLQRAQRVHALGGLAADVVDAARAAAGIYGAAPTCHLSLAVRLNGYTPELLDRAVAETRTLVRVPAMRGSIFLLPPDLVPAGLALAAPNSRSAFLRGTGIDDRAYLRIAETIERVVADRPAVASAIRAAMGRRAPVGPALGLVLRCMSHEGRIVRTTTQGSLRSQSFAYARTEDWIGPLTRPPRRDALHVLTPLWLRANGPATVADLAWWAGVPLREAADALASLDTTRVDVDEIGEDLFAPSDFFDDLDRATVAGGPHLLPVWDAWLMAHRDRGRTLDPSLAPYVVDRRGNVASSILLDGRVVGVWDVEDRALLFAETAGLDERDIERALQRIIAILPVDHVTRVDTPVPLDAGGQNAFRAPFRGRGRRS